MRCIGDIFPGPIRKRAPGCLSNIVPSTSGFHARPASNKPLRSHLDIHSADPQQLCSVPTSQLGACTFSKAFSLSPFQGTMPMPSKHRSERTHRQGQVHHDDRDEVVSWDSLSISSSSSYRSSDAARAAKLPALPDLRFEQSYLATIRSFLHERHPSSPNSPNNDDDDEEPSSPHNEKHTPDHDVDHHHKVEITRSNATNQYELWLGNLRVEWYVPLPPLLFPTCSCGAKNIC